MFRGRRETFRSVITLRAISLCPALELVVLSGVPMRTEEIRAYEPDEHAEARARVPSDEENGDGPPDDSALNERSHPPV